MEKRSMFVGMDVHKESIDISLAEEGRVLPLSRERRSPSYRVRLFCPRRSSAAAAC